MSLTWQVLLYDVAQLEDVERNQQKDWKNQHGMTRCRTHNVFNLFSLPCLSPSLSSLVSLFSSLSSLVSLLFSLLLFFVLSLLSSSPFLLSVFLPQRPSSLADSELMKSVGTFLLETFFPCVRCCNFVQRFLCAFVSRPFSGFLPLCLLQKPLSLHALRSFPTLSLFARAVWQRTRVRLRTGPQEKETGI